MEDRFLSPNPHAAPAAAASDAPDARNGAGRDAPLLGAAPDAPDARNGAGRDAPLLGAAPGGPAASSEALLAAVTASLEDDKAEDIVTIDLRGRSEMGDFMVIASGRSTRQVASIAEHLADRLKQDHGVRSKMEGREAADWVLIDTGDVIVHVFRPEVRDFYQLEKMWMPAGSLPARAAV